MKRIAEILILSLILISCGNQSTETQTLAEVIKEVDNRQTDTRVFEFDTVFTELNLTLSVNQFKYLDRGFDVQFREDYTDHYDDYGAEITLLKNGKVMFLDTIQKELFRNYIPDQDFLSTAVYGYTRFHSLDTNLNVPVLLCMMSTIESDNAYWFTVRLVKGLEIKEYEMDY